MNDVSVQSTAIAYAYPAVEYYSVPEKIATLRV